MSSGSAINKWSERPTWFGKIDVDEYEKLASLGYTPKQLAMYYDIDENEFMWYYTLIGSPLKHHYDRGVLLQTAKEGITMTDAAAKGDNVNMVSRLDKLRQNIEFKNNVSKVFFDDIG